MAEHRDWDDYDHVIINLSLCFKVVVGISPLLWSTMTLYLLLNVYGWEAMFFLSILPLVIILAIGTKLQAIITQMALEIQERHVVVQGIPLVQVTDQGSRLVYVQLHHTSAVCIGYTGHPSGAINIPYMYKVGSGMSKNPEFVKEVSSYFRKDDEIIVGCQLGKRSMMAATDLLASGFSGISNIAGGYAAWTWNGLPTEL